MGAREKLNRSYFQGSLLLAALSAWVVRSWVIFWVILALSLLLNLYVGEIRPRKRK